MPCENAGMASKSTTALETPLRDKLDRLAGLQANGSSIISLYLDMRPDQNGQRSHISTFLRNNADEQSRSLNGRARSDFQAALSRIEQHISEEVPKWTNSLAVFASTSGDLFEAIPL